MPLTFSYNSGSLSDSIRSIRSQVKDNSTWTQALTLYAAFMLVGAACGWLLVNCVFQYPTNYTDVENVFAGPSAIINGATGLSVTFLFAAFNMQFPHGLGLRGGQAAVGALCAMTVIGQFLLAGWWDIGSADGSFPVIFGALTLGNIVADLTELIAFPLVATEYGGYLVAPIRAGTDLSGGLVSTFGTLQAPQGGAGPHRFPMSYMQMSFGFLAVIALITWGISCTLRLDSRSKVSSTQLWSRRNRLKWRRRSGTLWCCLKTRLWHLNGGRDLRARALSWFQ
jgi:hypothetical protein